MARTNRMRTRAKAQMPMVLLTLLSILQALALELLWGYVREQEHLIEASWSAALSCAQVIATLLGILVIWIYYSSMVMRFRWVPSTSDTLYPFLIGILQFMLIETLGLETLGHWFVVLGILFAVTSGALQLVLRRARLDGENDDWFGSFSPATLRDFYPVIGIAALLVGLGVALAITGHQGWFAGLALLAANAALGYQMYLSHQFWERSMKWEPPTSPERPNPDA
jgi:hypothetical protein